MHSSPVIDAKICGHYNYSISIYFESDITIYDTYQVDEAFFTGTAAEVTPIQSINGKRVNKKDVGKMTSKIRKAYMNCVQGKNKNWIHYLTFI